MCADKGIKLGLFLPIDWKFIRAIFTELVVLDESLTGLFFAGVDVVSE